MRRKYSGKVNTAVNINKHINITFRKSSFISVIATKILLIIVFFMMGIVVTRAEEPTRAQQSSACMGDAFKFCGLDIPDEKEIATCLKANFQKLTPKCRAMFPAPSVPIKTEPKRESLIKNKEKS